MKNKKPLLFLKPVFILCMLISFFSCQEELLEIEEPTTTTVATEEKDFFKKKSLKETPKDILSIVKKMIPTLTGSTNSKNNNSLLEKEITEVELDSIKFYFFKLRSIPKGHYDKEIMIAKRPNGNIQTEVTTYPRSINNIKKRTQQAKQNRSRNQNSEDDRINATSVLIEIESCILSSIVAVGCNRGYTYYHDPAPGPWYVNEFGSYTNLCSGNRGEAIFSPSAFIHCVLRGYDSGPFLTKTNLDRGLVQIETEYQAYMFLAMLQSLIFPHQSNGNSNGNSNSNDGNPNNEDDDQIINELTGKVKCIYDKLTSSSKGFKNMIQKFDGDFPVNHLKFVESYSLPQSINAETSPPSNYITTITINSNKLNRPNLAIARDLIHETIHAEMFRKILSIIDNGGDLNGLTRSEWTAKLSNGDYPGIFDYYTRYGVIGMQHEQMAAHYINTISGYLEEFEPGLPPAIYASLAFTGLKGTTTWNSLSTSEQNVINNIADLVNRQGGDSCN